MNSIKESKLSRYTFFSAKNEVYKTGIPVISVIIDCYYGLGLLKKSIESVLSQSYTNTELVLIDNGAISDVSNFLQHTYDTNINVSLVKFNENQFSWNDTGLTVVMCWNAGLLCSKGEIVTHLSYDDELSIDCCSKMAKLFIDNKKCVTAAPLPVSINIKGEVNKNLSKALRENNIRPRYMSGKKLAIDFIKESPSRYFSSPGGIFFTRKDILIKYGGFDRSSDITQTIKFAIHGESGFDLTAKLFWRHHENQVNKLGKLKGITWCNDLKSVIQSENIVSIWKNVFTKNDIALLKSFVKRESVKNVKCIAIELLRSKEIYPLFNSLKKTFFKCPKIAIFVLWSLILEVYNMLIYKLLKKKSKA